ncbi:MAG: hypothetical protein JNM69_26885 [Archangium sp.]|nr:hypothetical protein [Archangium sp.]
MASKRKSGMTYQQLEKALEAGRERGRRREEAAKRSTAKTLARVSRFQKERSFIEISTSGTSLVVRTGTVGGEETTRRTRFGDEKKLERAVKLERAHAILARFRAVRAFK